MKAVVCVKLGNPATPIHLVDAPLRFHSHQPPVTPVLENGHVKIRIAASSVNFADALQVMGKYQERPPLPYIPGSEVSGTVLEVALDVRHVAPGDRVCAVVGTGGFAEEVVCRESNVFVLPHGCHDLAAAACLPVAFGTSHLALVHRAGLRQGQVLLVLGAGGGVGLAAVQIGKLCGATVIAVARGQAKAAVLRGYGADCVVDTEALGSTAPTGIADAVRAFLKSAQHQRGSGGPRRPPPCVDVLFDCVGGPQLRESLRVLSWGTQLLVVGFASGDIPVIPANVALVKNWTIHGIYWGSYFINCPSVLRDSMATLLAWLASGALRVHVSHVYSLQQADEAFKTLLERRAVGKVVLAQPEVSVAQWQRSATAAASKL